jgi:hypothetical protein
MNEVEIVQDVESGKLHSAHAAGRFDKAVEALTTEGYRIISLEELAGLRVQEGIKSSVSGVPCMTRECIIHWVDKIVLAKDSPFLMGADLEEYNKCYREKQIASFWEQNMEVIGRAMKQSIRMPEEAVMTRIFGYEDFTKFAFGKNARAYGDLLEASGTHYMHMHRGLDMKKPVVEQMSPYTVTRSGRVLFHGCGWILDDNVVMRGVKDAL